MIGSALKVVVTAENGNTFESDETEEVGVYEALEILSAEQTGANTVLLTFSAPVTTNDTIAVFKGAAEQVIASRPFADTTFTSVELTMKNNFANGTYTVTLTPEDEDVDPSSVEFEAQAATKAAYIDVKGEKFLMKNTEFEEGYCFIEGYNEFGEPIALTGLSVNVAPSDSISFDSSTGKVTAKFKDHGYAIVPTVSVFASYTAADGNILTCQKTLEVASIGYPSEIEFGDVKIEGVADDTVTINDLATNKYYVELDVVKDQAGNDLSAEDLNDLEDEDLLTVIPQSGSPIFFGTNENPFSTVNGKVVVYLTPATAGKEMPGIGQLMITGAGGTFSKEIQIWDNPYIDEFTVDIPDLYQGEWSDEITLSAVDQYEDPIDLWDFAPELNGKKLHEIEFTDKNRLTGISTKISAENAGTWEVKKDTIKKNFTLRYKPAGAAKQVATFTIITAGLDNNVVTRTIGARGAGAQIVAQNGAYALVENKTTAQNLNKLVSFKDANGKVMVRTDCYETYPKFLTNPTLVATNSEIKDKDITAWYWTVTENKIPETATAAEVAAAIGKYDANGEITIGANTATELKANATNATPSYYITLLGLSGGAYKVLDSKAFRFAYTPAAGDTIYKKYVDTVSGTLWASEDGYTTKTITVLAQNESGEEWKPDQTKVTLTADAPFTTDGATIKGDFGKNIGDGNVSVKVFYAGEPVDTISIPYSDDTPVATKTEVKLYTKTRMGKDWDATTKLTKFDTSDDYQADATFADGTLTITDVNNFRDTLTAVIKDQYDQVMKSSIVELNGKAMNNDVIAADKIANFVMTNGSQKVDLELEVGDGTLIANKPTTVSTTKITASTADDLDNAIKLATADTAQKYEITVSNAVTSTADVIVPANATLKVTSGGTLSVSGKLTVADKGTMNVAGTLLTGTDVVEINGALVLNGRWIHNGAKNITVAATTGSVTGTGHFKSTQTITINDNGNWKLTGDTTELAGATTVSGTGTFGGNVVVDKNASLTFDAATKVSANIVVESNTGLTLGTTAILQDGAVIDLSKGGTITPESSAKLAENATVTIITASGATTKFTTAKGTTDATLDIAATGVATATAGDPAKVSTTVTATPSMDALNTVATAYGTSITDLTDLWTGVSIAAPVKTTTDDGDIVYTYEVSGTLKYIPEANADGVSVKTLGFGGTAARHWFFGVDHKALDSTMTAVKVSDGAVKYSTSADAMAAVKSSGLSVDTADGATADKDTWICGAKTDGEQYMAIYYEFADGVEVYHVYHIPASCFEPVPSSSEGD